jgi:cysteine desulfurase
MDTIYLDYAAATPMDQSVFVAMQPYFTERFYNPSATYLAAQAIRKDLEAARGKVAYWLGSRPSEVIFTAGSTEANNLVINGVMWQYPQATIVVSAIEHESVLAPAHQYACKELGVSATGLTDLEALRGTIDDQTVLVSIMYANNEVGTIQPIHKIGQLLAEIRRDRRLRGITLPLYFHTDAAQAANYLDLHVARLGVDFMTLNGGKIYGPKQAGVLYVNAHAKIQPQIKGGGQERGLRSGTENIAGAIGLSVALEMVQADRHSEVVRLQALQKQFIDLLVQRIPNVVVNGSQSYRLPNNIHITIPGKDNERILMALDEAGILCAAGSACSASNEEPSHVLRAMGLSDAEAQASLRFTMGRQTTQEELIRTAETLTSLI